MHLGNLVKIFLVLTKSNKTVSKHELLRSIYKDTRQEMCLSSLAQSSLFSPFILFFSILHFLKFQIFIKQFRSILFIQSHESNSTLKCNINTSQIQMKWKIWDPLNTNYKNSIYTCFTFKLTLMILLLYWTPSHISNANLYHFYLFDLVNHSFKLVNNGQRPEIILEPKR